MVSFGRCSCCVCVGFVVFFNIILGIVSCMFFKNVYIVRAVLLFLALVLVGVFFGCIYFLVDLFPPKPGSRSLVEGLWLRGPGFRALPWHSTWCLIWG